MSKVLYIKANFEYYFIELDNDFKIYKQFLSGDPAICNIKEELCLISDRKAKDNHSHINALATRVFRAYLPSYNDLLYGDVLIVGKKGAGLSRERIAELKKILEFEE